MGKLDATYIRTQGREAHAQAQAEKRQAEQDALEGDAVRAAALLARVLEVEPIELWDAGGQVWVCQDGTAAFMPAPGEAQDPDLYQYRLGWDEQVTREDWALRLVLDESPPLYSGPITDLASLGAALAWQDEERQRLAREAQDAAQAAAEDQAEPQADEGPGTPREVLQALSASMQALNTSLGYVAEYLRRDAAWEQ